MKYYVVIGHKKGEAIEGNYPNVYECDWIEMIERDDEYSPSDLPPGAHQMFGFLDVNFNESVQYGARATKTQEAWLIGRHRIARMLDFGNFGYQFVRETNTKRIQFPDRITLSFDKRIKDNGVNKPFSDARRVDIELTELNEQIINCYDKECVIDPVVFKLAKFDNYGDAYIDLQKIEDYQEFQVHIDHFVHFMKNYPNSNVYLVCPRERELELKTLLRTIIKKEHLTNYFEFCDRNFERRYPGYMGKKSGTPNSEYDTFSETIDEFFNEHTFNKSLHGERNFYNVPFRKAKITINDNWDIYTQSHKFIKFLQYNPDLTLEIAGTVESRLVAQFIRANSIKATIVLTSDPTNIEIKEAIAYNRKDELNLLISQHGYDELEPKAEVEDDNEEYRLALEKYAPQKLNLAQVENHNADMQVGQNQNQNQNQNQSQQLRQSNNAPYVPEKLEINNKSSIPDVNFAPQDALLKTVIGLDFQSKENAPQTESNINYLLAAMEKIIQHSPASKDCYCPLSYSVEELVPGAFYVPQGKLASIPHPRSYLYTFDDKKNTLFFSPPYASIAIKKDKYAFKPYHRPIDSSELLAIPTLNYDIAMSELLASFPDDKQEDKFLALLNKLYAKRGQAGIDLLTKALHSLMLKNPAVYKSLIQDYLLTSNDFSEYVDGTRFISTIDALAKLKDQKKIDWWNKLLKIQCKTNPNFDLSHLFSQFTGFWEDMEKLQKFLPIPDQFPFDDFADAGITLGKMYRIMISARNRFEQIKNFEGGNISHAYMLFDLFNSSMYCKEMDEYCVLLTKQLKAEDAFDKRQLKETYFSTAKLVDLTEDTRISLEQLKSYLIVFAAVNGNTEKHNNSDLAFYKSLFKIIEEAIQDKYYSEFEKKIFYSTVMLFAAYGNNTTKERMSQDIKNLASNSDTLGCCRNILGLHKEKTVSAFYSAQESNGKMTNSEAMLSFHTVVSLTQKHSDYARAMTQTTDLIIRNKFLSQALQKVMREAPERLKCFTYEKNYLEKRYGDREQYVQSIYIIAVTLNPNCNHCFDFHYNNFSSALAIQDIEKLRLLNQLFLDIDYAKFPKPSTLFTGTYFSSLFCDRVAKAQNLDDLIFVLQDHNVPLSTIKPSEQGLLVRIKQLESNLAHGENKKHYITNYHALLQKRLHSILGDTPVAQRFYKNIISTLDSSLSPYLLKSSFEALVKILETKKKEDLVKVLTVLEDMEIGTELGCINPAPLLNVTAYLLKNNHPVEGIVKFIEIIKENHPQDANRKLLYVQTIFEKITQEPTCYENNDLKKKLSKKTTDQIKACIELVKIIEMDEGDYQYIKAPLLELNIPLYLQFLEALASPSNINNSLVKKNFAQIHSYFHLMLSQYPECFSDILEITQFDAKLIVELSFRNQKEIRLVAKICKNEALLNSRRNEQPATDYKQVFTKNIKTLLAKQLELERFYSEEQLAHPTAQVLVDLLNHYQNNLDKALHHYEKDPWFNRPHKKQDIYGKSQVDDKELAYQTGQFDMTKHNDVLDQITRNDSGLEKSVRRNLLFTLATYINELGYRLPAFEHSKADSVIKVPVRKLSNKELKAEFEKVRNELASLRDQGQDDIWQNKKHQRAVGKLLAIIREAIYRNGNKNAYSTQMDAILLALLAGDYQYAMQINTGEGKIIIAAAIAVALQTITDKQIVVTTSNLSLAGRDSEAYNSLIKWFGISHATVSATTKDKRLLQAKIIHTTGNDFALCHGKDVVINNSNRIYLNDEYDYTLSHLTPSINSQSKRDEEENWWIYEEILAYVAKMDEKEARKKAEQQARGLIEKLTAQFNESIRIIEEELTHKVHLIDQNADNKSPEEQVAAKEAVEKECHSRIEFYAKRIAKMSHAEAEDQFNTLIDSAIIAQFALKKGVAYEVIDQFEEGKTFKKVVPTEGGKPITEGDVLYMYGIHQFLIQKTIMEYREAGDLSEFLTPSALESTTYFNNYSTQAGSKAIGITGTVPKEKYKMYEALIGGGKSDVIPPHQESQRIDTVPYERFHEVDATSEHVSRTEEQLISKLVKAIKNHDGPALIYCANKNVCDERRDALIKQLQAQGYTVQMIIPGITENFTEGDKLTSLGRQAQNKKTVTLTVGDGRGIDISPQGKDGLLTLCSFVPETPEKILQIYGRSGRNGNPGKTNLFILESELTKYDIKFKNLAEEFKFLDELRHKEFNFVIKKIGFMQYEIQKQIRDEQKKTSVIGYMDDLYNRLVLKAVSEKVKNKKGNWIGAHQITGKWEPFVMLNDEELEHIYQEFCKALTVKLQDMQLHHIDIEEIIKLQKDYHQQVKQAIEQEKSAQAGQKKEAIRDKIVAHSEKQRRKLAYSFPTSAELSDGTVVDLSDGEVNNAYLQWTANLSKYDKTLSLMQKYIGTHVGIYGFIQDDIVPPYEELVQLLDEQKQTINKYRQKETDIFYEYLIYTESLKAIRLLLQDKNSGSKHYQAQIEQHFQKAERYANMTHSEIRLANNTVANIRDKALRYYENGVLSYWDEHLFNELGNTISWDIERVRQVLRGREEVILEQCLETYKELQDKIQTQGIEPLSTLTDKPLKAHNSQLSDLFAMLQMVKNEERHSEPVRKVIDEVSRRVDPDVSTYNLLVTQYKEIIKKQRACFEVLQRPHDSRDKINKYEKMVAFADIASKNMVGFYHGYHKLPETSRALKLDIKKEQEYLDQLEIEKKLLLDERFKQAVKNKRKQYLDKIEAKIKTALGNLSGRINQIDHPLSEALTVANLLFHDLSDAQTNYLIKLEHALNNLDLKILDFADHPSIKEVHKAYTQSCEALINDPKTRRVLERDLNWGPYLNNLLKTIVNIVISAVTFGCVNNFFTLKKSETIRTIDEAKESLSPC